MIGPATAALIIWLGATMAMIILAVVLGSMKMRMVFDELPAVRPASHRPRVEVLIPVKGSFPDQRKILQSMLEQTYRAYEVVFLLESETDPANEAVDRLAQEYPHARKIITGLSKTCAQKNHNLVAGIECLGPDTEIIVLCDSTNMVDREWLDRFIRPIEAGTADVVTTFREFTPEPETLGGSCQAIYSAFVLLLIALRPKPWGGATGIRRTTFDKLDVTSTWARTVVDDLVLGNILDRSGIRVRMDPQSLLTSPVRNQTVGGFLDYLDRQILFPKFTNPGLWLFTLMAHLNTTLAVAVSLILGVVLLPLGLVSQPAAVASLSFLGCLLLTSLVLRATNRRPISVKAWLGALLPCIFLAAFIFIRSVFRNYIVWHGRKYLPGRGGVVLKTDGLSG